MGSCILLVGLCGNDQDLLCQLPQLCINLRGGGLQPHPLFLLWGGGRERLGAVDHREHDFAEEVHEVIDISGCRQGVLTNVLSVHVALLKGFKGEKRGVKGRMLLQPRVGADPHV